MYLARILDRILALILVCRFPVNQNIVDDDSYLSDLLVFIDRNNVTKRVRFASCKHYVNLHHLANLQIPVTKMNLKSDWWLMGFNIPKMELLCLALSGQYIYEIS